MKRYETTLSAARIENLTTLMEKKDITIDCTLPVRFVPMSRIKMKTYDYDYIALEKIFFKDLKNIVRTEELERVILKSDIGELAVEGSTVWFSTKTEVAKTVTEAIAISDDYVKDLNESFSNYTFNNVMREKDGFRIIYYEEYSGSDIFSNYAEFKLYNDGELKVSLCYYEPVEQGGERNTIIAADEAVFALSDKIQDRGVTIDKVSQGYLISENSTDETAEMDAIPVYSIKTGEGIYFVNAVDGSVSEKVFEL
jgi:hypothetical protein